jgi:hypothetical protein
MDVEAARTNLSGDKIKTARQNAKTVLAVSLQFQQPSFNRRQVSILMNKSLDPGAIPGGCPIVLLVTRFTDPGCGIG